MGVSVKEGKCKGKGKSKHVGFGPGSDKAKGQNGGFSSGFKVGRQVLKSVNGPVGKFGVGHEVCLGNNFEVLQVSNKLGNGKHAAVRPLVGDQTEFFKGKENKTFVFGGNGQRNSNPKCSLASDKRGQFNKMSSEVGDDLDNSLVEVGAAMDVVVAQLTTQWFIM